MFPVLFVGCETKNHNINIIPQPEEIQVQSGQFTITPSTIIIVDSYEPRVKEVAKYFVNQFNRVSGFTLKIVEKNQKNIAEQSIILSDQNVNIRSEGYIFESNDEGIIIKGTAHGLFYGIQTLFQLLPPEIYKDKSIENIVWSIPIVKIQDKPRFKWRGMHLDVGRHMFPVSFIKRHIDFIAMHKMNTFHWHLTEDQGWRIEIKKYPKLTEIGSWRKGTQIGKTKEIDNIPYGGFYTQDEIKEIVSYAADRFINVVPEIEMPGHSVAALTSYPHLSCTGGPFEVRTLWGIEDDIYCAGNDSVFTFLENVLMEVIDLFPSKYIHIGGDEAPKTRWENCSKCQQRIKKERLHDEHELQSYFITRIEKFLNSKERQIIGWDEILEGGLAPNAAVMSWRGIEGGIEAAKQKHNVVMTPTDYCYFDYYQAPPENEPLAIGGYLTLEKVYSFEPVPEELNSDEQKYIIGVQANQWTEYIATPELAEYMTIPRLSALSEIAWSPKEKRDYSDFINRMSTQYRRFDELGVNYHWPYLEGLEPKNVFINSSELNLVSKIDDSEIRYTTDGTNPSQTSKLYSVPIKISETMEIRIREFTSNGKSSPIYSTYYVKEIPLDPIIVDTGEGGISFKYYEITQPIYSVLELSTLEPKSNGKLDKIEFPFPDNKLAEMFGINFSGYIRIHKEDVYTFGVNSNDGSQLYIADRLVVDNDGEHGAYEKEGQIALKKGIHKIRILYFQAGGGKELEVSIKDNKTGIKDKLVIL